MTNEEQRTKECVPLMKLITYMDDGTLRTLMVDRFLDRYNTAGGYIMKYGVGEHKIEILEADIVAVCEIPREQWL